MGFSRQEYWSGVPFPSPAVGVLIQKLGEVPQPIDCFPTRFHDLWLAWFPPSMEEEANKLTFGQPREIQTPLQIQGILEMKGHHWLTEGHPTKVLLLDFTPLLQALLLDSPELNNQNFPQQVMLKPMEGPELT